MVVGSGALLGIFSYRLAPRNAAKENLSGSRFYAFYRREELTDYFSDFIVEKERRDILKEGEGAMEFWLRKE